MRTALLALATFIAAVRAAEHPHEHPHEQPRRNEHRSGKPDKVPIRGGVKLEHVAKAARMLVEKDAALKGGYFLFFDAAGDRPLALTLVRIHEDRLARVGGDDYFVCADFESREGASYDLDFFVHGAYPDYMTVQKIQIHKVAGQPRYRWVEQGGVWSTAPVK